MIALIEMETPSTLRFGIEGLFFDVNIQLRVHCFPCCQVPATVQLGVEVKPLTWGDKLSTDTRTASEAL